jgi:hypothetical protein
MKRTRRWGGASALAIVLMAGSALASGPIGSIATGSGPGRPVISHGKVFVSVDEGVAVADLETGELISTFSLKPSPEQVAVDAARNRVWALQSAPHNARHPGWVTVLDAENGSVIKTLDTDRGPTAIEFDSRYDLVYIVNFYAGSIQVRDAESFEQVARLGGRRWAEGKVGNLEDIVMDRGRGVAYVSTNWGYVIELRDGRVIERKRILRWADDHSMAIDPIRRLLYVGQLETGNVLVLRTSPLERARKIKPPRDPWGVAIDPELQLLGVLGDTNKAAWYHVLDLKTGKWIAETNLGLGGSRIVSLPGSWRFYISDEFWGSIYVFAAEDTSPASEMELADGQSLEPGESLSGFSNDDRSGIKTVSVVFENPASRHEMSAMLSCSTELQCTWTVQAPDQPGAYDVTTLATDQAGNLEVDEQAVRVTVLP